MYVCGYESRTGKDRKEKKQKFVLGKYLLQPRPSFNKPQSTVEPRLTNASHHEQIFRTKNVSGDERCLQ
jgi:hypothetical protein